MTTRPVLMFAVFSAATVFLPASASAATFYVDGPSQFMSQVNRLQSGDKVIVRGDGDYGALDLYDRNFTRLTHIRVNSGVGATFDRINLTRCSNLRLTRVRVRPKTRTTAVYINGGHRVEIYSSDIAFAETSHDWTQNDWNSKTESGIRTTPSGTNHRFLYNTIHSVRHGIEIWSDSTLARHNHINQFNGRAIRIFANQAKVYDNLITNNQHTDGATVAIQS
ncbi:MAG: hypothetical protein AAFQ82_13310, partial [Myxococcota bacterium]